MVNLLGVNLLLEKRDTAIGVFRACAAQCVHPDRRQRVPLRLLSHSRAI